MCVCDGRTGGSGTTLWRGCVLDPPPHPCSPAMAAEPPRSSSQSMYQVSGYQKHTVDRADPNVFATTDRWAESPASASFLSRARRSSTLSSTVVLSLTSAAQSLLVTCLSRLSSFSTDPDQIVFVLQQTLLQYERTFGAHMTPPPSPPGWRERERGNVLESEKKPERSLRLPYYLWMHAQCLEGDRRASRSS